MEVWKVCSWQLYTYRGGCSTVGQTLCEKLADETKGNMDYTGQTVSIELQHVRSYEDDQLKVLKLVFCAFLGSNLNLVCHIKLIKFGF